MMFRTLKGCCIPRIIPFGHTKNNNNNQFHSMDDIDGNSTTIISPSSNTVISDLDDVNSETNDYADNNNNRNTIITSTLHNNCNNTTVFDSFEKNLSTKCVKDDDDNVDNRCSAYRAEDMTHSSYISSKHDIISNESNLKDTATTVDHFDIMPMIVSSSTNTSDNNDGASTADQLEQCDITSNKSNENATDDNEMSREVPGVTIRIHPVLIDSKNVSETIVTHNTATLNPEDNLQDSDYSNQVVTIQHELEEVKEDQVSQETAQQIETTKLRCMIDNMKKNHMNEMKEYKISCDNVTINESNDKVNKLEEELRCVQNEHEILKAQEVEKAIQDTTRDVSLQMEQKHQSVVEDMKVLHTNILNNCNVNCNKRTSELHVILMEREANLRTLEDKIQKTKYIHKTECRNYESKLIDLQTHHDTLIKNQEMLFVDKLNAFEMDSNAKFMTQQNNHSNEITRIQNELNELKVCEVEKAIQDTTKSVSLKMKTKFQLIINEMKEQHDNEIETFKTICDKSTFESHSNQIELERKLKSVEDELQVTKQMNETECHIHDSKMNELKIHYETLMTNQEKTFEDTHKLLETENNNKTLALLEEHLNEISRIHRDLEESKSIEIEKVTQDTSMTVTLQMETKFQLLVDDLKQKNINDMETYKVSRDREIERVTSELHFKVGELEEKLNKAQEDFREKTQMYEIENQMLESKLSELKINYETLMQDQEKSFVEKLNALETDSNAKALVVQEDHSKEIASIQREHEESKAREIESVTQDTTMAVSLQMETKFQSVADDLNQKHINEMETHKMNCDKELERVTSGSHVKVSELEEQLGNVQEELLERKKMYEAENQILESKLCELKSHYETILKNQEMSCTEKFNVLETDSNAKALSVQEDHSKEIARIQSQHEESKAREVEKATQDTSAAVSFQVETKFQSTLDKMMEQHMNQMERYRTTCENERTSAIKEVHSKLSELEQNLKNAETSKEDSRLELMQELQTMQVLIVEKDSTIESLNNVMAKYTSDAENCKNTISHQGQELQTAQEEIERVNSMFNDACDKLKSMEEKHASIISNLQSEHVAMLEKTEEESKGLQEKTKLNETLEKELVDMRQKFDYQAQTHEEEVTQLKLSIDMMTLEFQKQHEIAILSSNAELNAKCELLQEKDSKLQSFIDQAKSLRVELAQLHEKNNILNSNSVSVVDDRKKNNVERNNQETTGENASERELTEVSSTETLVEVTNTNNLVASLKEQLKSSELHIAKNRNEFEKFKNELNDLQTQNMVLQKDIVEYSNKNVQMDYLKGVIVKCLSFQTGSDEWHRLIPVLASILHFDDNDTKIIEVGALNKNSWFIPTLITSPPSKHGNK